VCFVDNHDSFWQPGRIAKDADDRQVIASVGFLLCTLGTPCIYYGTEQGFSGGGGDNAMREAMFDKAQAGRDLLNTDCKIYLEIAKIAQVMRGNEPLRFGRLYYRQISGDNGAHFGFPFGTTYPLAFSRLLYGKETLVAYNVSSAARTDCVIVDATLHAGGKMSFLYGGVGDVPVQTAPDGSRFVQLALAGHGFAILV
jgi:alpha-amylase